MAVRWELTGGRRPFPPKMTTSQPATAERPDDEANRQPRVLLPTSEWEWEWEWDSRQHRIFLVVSVGARDGLPPLCTCR